MCQGLLDLKRMTDDFRERLLALIEREEKVVEKLEQYEAKQSSRKEVSSSSGMVNFKIFFSPFQYL